MMAGNWKNGKTKLVASWLINTPDVYRSARKFATENPSAPNSLPCLAQVRGNARSNHPRWHFSARSRASLWRAQRCSLVINGLISVFESTRAR